MPWVNKENLERFYTKLKENVYTKDENLALSFYPVGSVYFSVNNTNPSTLFGGTWELISSTLGTETIYSWKRTA